MVRVRPTISDTIIRAQRLELLNNAVPIAGWTSDDHAREHRFRQALLDVVLDAVSPRTETAIEEARTLVTGYRRL